MKFEFHRPLFEKYSNIKFYEDSFRRAELFRTDGQKGERTEGQTEGRKNRQT